MKTSKKRAKNVGTAKPQEPKGNALPGKELSEDQLAAVSGGAPTMQDFHFTQTVNKSSTNLG